MTAAGLSSSAPRGHQLEDGHDRAHSATGSGGLVPFLSTPGWTCVVPTAMIARTIAVAGAMICVLSGQVTASHSAQSAPRPTITIPRVEAAPRIEDYVSGGKRGGA